VNPSRLRHFIFRSMWTAAIGAAWGLLPLGCGSLLSHAEERLANDSKAEFGETWQPLTGDWTPCEFGGDGPIKISDDLIKLGAGSPMTGVRWKGEFPRENYELKLEARRTDGLDFFCGLTFPVGEDHVSFVLGGWGGGVVGISSIDGYDASENPTTMYKPFKTNQWYQVRVRVSDDRIECWIDDKQVVDQLRQGHKFDIRFEMDQSLPMGIAAFQTKSELRKIALRMLTPAEIEQAKEKRETDTTIDKARIRGE